MINAIAVGFGGSLGAMLRYFLGFFLQNSLRAHHLMPTFAVNFIGCFIIGYLAEVDFKSAVSLKYFLIAGLLGGFTTYSSFSLESVNLIRAGGVSKAAIYISGTVLFCLIAVLGGSSAYKLFH